jgi:hypothetical protein
MNKKLPNLPMEIINKILIMRPPHPVANLLKLYINHYEDEDWYYNKWMASYGFHLWFFAERDRNNFYHFKFYEGQMYLYKDCIIICESNRTYQWTLTKHENYIKNRIYIKCCFGSATERILGYIDKIHKPNLNLDNGTKRISK